MKLRFLIPIACSIFLGFILGKVIFSEYDNLSKDVFSETNNIYILQYGAYSNMDAMRSNTKILDNYIYEMLDKKYYVYVGITSNISNAEKVKNIYKNKGINLYIKEASTNNKDFLNSLSQYDILLKEATNERDILSINNVILTDYQELIINNK